jgi:hypothetical protein
MTRQLSTAWYTVIMISWSVVEPLAVVLSPTDVLADLLKNDLVAETFPSNVFHECCMRLSTVGVEHPER